MHYGIRSTHSSGRAFPTVPVRYRNFREPLPPPPQLVPPTCRNGLGAAEWTAGANLWRENLAHV